MDFKTLGKKIKKERQKRSLTQEKLAEKLDISESFLGQIERAETKLSIETLVKIATELNVSIDYLLMDSINTEPVAALNEIESMLSTKSPEQSKAFLKIIRVLSNNIDEWS